LTPDQRTHQTSNLVEFKDQLRHHDGLQRDISVGKDFVLSRWPSLRSCM